MHLPLDDWRGRLPRASADRGAPCRRSHSCPSSPLGFAGSAIYAMQQQAMAGTLHSRAAPPQRARALAPAPAGFVPVAEPQSPMAGLHWADGFAAQPRQQSPPPNSAAAAATFFSTGSQSLPCLDVTGLAAFKTMEMDLEQVGRAADAAMCGACLPPGWCDLRGAPFLQDPTAPWETDKPWYFGSSLDLATLSLPKPLPMDCSSNAASGGDDDDDIPLLTLDLGGEALAGTLAPRRFRLALPGCSSTAAHQRNSHMRTPAAIDVSI